MPGRIMMDPSRYAGRNDIIREAHQYLSNGRSLFITGRRGVGKSSLATQIRQLMSRSSESEERFGIKGSSSSCVLNVMYRCDGTETLTDFASRLLHSMERASGYQSVGAGKTVNRLKFNLKVVSYERADETATEAPHVISRFSELVIDWARQVRSVEDAEVTFWIDEADLLIERVNVGVFLKVVLENASDAGLAPLRFVLTGLNRALDRLRQQHPSITRFLMPVEVPPMGPDELTELVDRAIDPTSVSFEPDVREALYLMSQGFPDPVHLLGYELFEAALGNVHNVATPKTFNEVLRKVSTGIKKDELRSVEAKIPSTECEKLLYSAALFPREFCTALDLANHLEWKEDRCRELCAQLCDLQFLEQDGRRGFRFADPLFKIYLTILEAQRDANAKFESKRNELTSRAQLHMQSNEKASGAFRADTDRELLRIILNNFKTTGRTGMWS